ncbi:MAG: 1-deoxy-D-xylulose-5-phosphate reductoisomerase, partial [bacterium]|nr:1-deoxy-D-xylulose-5-phosphate reductoisomerase [bacterium]
VEFTDGSVLAQVSVTDMRMPIQYAMTYPDRLEAPVERYDWSKEHSWEFAPPDMDKFPLLKLAYEAQEAGGNSTCTLNAADEVAVDAFLQGRIPFPAISEVARETLERVPRREPGSVAEVLDIDLESRRVAQEIVGRRSAAWPGALPAAAR